MQWYDTSAKCMCEVSMCTNISTICTLSPSSNKSIELKNVIVFKMFLFGLIGYISPNNNHLESLDE